MGQEQVVLVQAPEMKRVVEGSVATWKVLLFVLVLLACAVRAAVGGHAWAAAGLAFLLGAVVGPLVLALVFGERGG